MKLFFKEMKSPVGVLKLIASDRALIAILWETDTEGRVSLQTATRNIKHPILNEAEAQLREYFSGARAEFNLPLDPIGTEFQKKVWRALTQIRFGTTTSYGELAKVIGTPKAYRAVGAANGKNPLSIVVPCHRVIGSNGKLVGFAGGLKTKAVLLRLENQTNRNVKV